MPEVFHLALPAHWTAAVATGEYAMSTRDRTLADEGYVHCSFAAQVSATAARYYSDVDEVVLLRIDTDRLASPVVVEDLGGTGEAFPHVYGLIELDAVVEARRTHPLAIAI